MSKLIFFHIFVKNLSICRKYKRTKYNFVVIQIIYRNDYKGLAGVDNCSWTPNQPANKCNGILYKHFLSHLMS